MQYTFFLWRPFLSCQNKKSRDFYIIKIAIVSYFSLLKILHFQARDFRRRLPAGHGSGECKKVAYDGGLSMIDDAVEPSANDSELE